VVKINVTYEDGKRSFKLFARDQKTLDKAAEILTALKDAGCQDAVDEFVAKVKPDDES